MTFAQHLGHLGLFFVILLGPVPLSLWLAGKEPGGFAHGCFIALLGWCVLQTSLALVLGSIGCLKLSAILVSEGLLFLCGVCSLRPPGKIVMPVLNLSETLLLVLIASVGIGKMWQILSEPITDYDSLAYHLPAMAKWYQSGWLHGGLEQFQANPIRGYPYHWEVLCSLFVIPFGEDFCVALPNLAAWALLGIGAYLAAVTLKSRRIFAMAAAALLLTMPIVAEHLCSLRTDLPLAAFFVSCLYLALVFRRTRAGWSLALFLASLGMCFGVRTSGIVYGSLLAVFFGTTGLEGFRFTRPVFAGLLCFLFLGGFWYAKNCLEMANPLGSGVQLSFAGKTVFGGQWGVQSIFRTTLAHLFDPGNPAHWKILLGQIQSRLGVPFAAMALSLIFLPRAISKNFIKALTMLLVVTALLYWLTPVGGDNGTHGWRVTPWIGQGLRYAFPCLSVLAILSAVLWSDASMPEAAAVPVVLIGSVLCLAPGHLMVLPVVFVLVSAVFKPVIRPGFLPTCGILAVFVVLSFLAHQKRESFRTLMYDGIQDYLEAHVGKDETVGYLLSHRGYLLYGKGWNRKVVYVPAAGGRKEWLQALKNRNVSLIAVGPLRGEWKSRPEISWLNEKNGPFTRVFGENPDLGPALYRLKGSTP